MLRAQLADLARRHPCEALLAVAGLVGFVCGTRYVRVEAALTAWAVIAAALFWLAFNWAIRRPRAMRSGLFLLRRKELAAIHGLSPYEIDLYPDVAT